ncbi:hypothetical protein BSLG_010677 [Batrachochytrium salamandrivorans]|nr:hypothetical protein BSLG_010677 [Batrachochytrium salamandrivorans]
MVPRTNSSRRMAAGRKDYVAVKRQDSSASLVDEATGSSSGVGIVIPGNEVFCRASSVDPGFSSTSPHHDLQTSTGSSNNRYSYPGGMDDDDDGADHIPLRPLGSSIGTRISPHAEGPSYKSTSSDIDSEEAGRFNPNRIHPLHPTRIFMVKGWFRSLYQAFGKGPRLGTSRTIELGLQAQGFELNVVRNQKYNPLTFVPIVLYEQFKFFFNMYFLLVALSQLIKALQIGYLFTYFGPLSFVLVVTMGKEALDDYKRYQRDKEANSQKYVRLCASGPSEIPSSHLCVGDLVVIHKNQRVPADCILLRTTEASGACFIRTDQLDGETDWKLRVAVPYSQKLSSDMAIFQTDASIYAEKPQVDIHEFIGNITWVRDRGTHVDPLTVDNTLWMNTVLASGSAVGLVIYTGRDTRAVMNTSFPSTKIGLLDLDINRLSKILAVVTLGLSVTMVMMDGFRGLWFVYIFRFLILFSSIIPISLRVNLDMGKTVFSYQIMTDKKIPSTIVRTSTIPEELGRIDYLLTDKTGTLTKNGMYMELRKLHMGTISYGTESMEEVIGHIRTALDQTQVPETSFGVKRSKGIGARLKDIIVALALCHNVTPVFDEEGELGYQASSPDEVAIVKWTESIGLTLYFRDMSLIRLKTMHGNILDFEIINVFPFTSETKRMGIILRDKTNGEITFYQKGADVVMTRIVAYNDWLDEECGNMAREGLRTLVIGRKRLSEDYCNEFLQRYQEAKISLQGRQSMMQAVISQYLEKDLELLGLTGVEDKLQDGVKLTLELLRNAGLRIWMLTGDKIETATCISISSKLVARNQQIHTIAKVTDPTAILEELDAVRNKTDCALVIDGESLQTCLDFSPDTFMALALCLPVVAAHVGVGIVGKEGMQASLAADFSITQFSHIARLLLWHGRNSYKRSAKLSQFVIHRGLIISIMQAVFSSLFYFSPYCTVPDKDISQDTALTYPELYKELVKGRALSYKTFFIWLLISVYQGGAIMMLAIWLFENEFVRVVSISFTALVFNELLMVALEITTW